MFGEGNNPNLKIDLRKLAHGSDRIYYYDSYPSRKRDEEEVDFKDRERAQNDLFGHFGRLQNTHVRTGYSRFQRKRHVQKGVDVLLAVDALEHSYRRNCESAFLLLGDLDFIPLIDALVSNGTRVIVGSFGGSISEEIPLRADYQFRINAHDVASSFLPGECPLEQVGRGASGKAQYPHYRGNYYNLTADVENFQFYLGSDALFVIRQRDGVLFRSRNRHHAEAFLEYEYGKLVWESDDQRSEFDHFYSLQVKQ
jgi:uncharacterized LabA/DUF88 family protein